MKKFFLLLKKLYSSNRTEVEKTKKKHTIYISDEFHGVLRKAVITQNKYGLEGDDIGSVIRHALSLYLVFLNRLENGEGGLYTVHGESIIDVNIVEPKDKEM